MTRSEKLIILRDYCDDCSTCDDECLARVRGVDELCKPFEDYTDEELDQCLSKIYYIPEPQPTPEPTPKPTPEPEPVSLSTREQVLAAARTAVCGHRATDYGTPEDNFGTIAKLWSVYKGTQFTATDVAMMMALLKVARIKSGSNTTDSFVDLAGYAACAAECAEREGKHG